MNNSNYALRYFCERANLGAADAVKINVKDIVVSNWVPLKCKYGCSAYGTSFTCPPSTPTPDETRAILSEYSWGILLRFVATRTHDDYNEYIRFKRSIWKIAAKLERELFLEQYYRSFALNSGPCPLCNICKLLSSPKKVDPFSRIFSLAKQAINQPELIKKAVTKPKLVKQFARLSLVSPACRFPKIARPSMEAVGIDVFKTVRNAGFNIKVLQSIMDTPTYFGMVLVE